ncbi:endoglucanase 13-like [Mizuhopecten yessoensis]|uniref:Endoglucanase n=1 Tax=Mizuhopecten yessoensis TaxID=6573 RepID=C6L866_MIZYE|nr:endoglucanase 13-like [Mizuhopecten yessoensis]OWF45590.1 Endoglucanase A [Mizuhopecten yessoensis]BAH85844.1 endoglucanase [Mizuhopecten yessoensis]
MLRLLVLAVTVTLALGGATNVQITNEWPGGFQGTFTLHPDHALHGWKAHLQFSKPVDKVEIWKASVISKSNNNQEYVLQNVPGVGDIEGGSSLDVIFVARASGDHAGPVRVFLEGVDAPGSGSSSGSTGGTSGGGSSGTGESSGGSGTPISGGSSSVGSSTKYDYGNALGLSILFYDAQRSGRLPGNNPIPWRSNSATGDGSDVGTDLSGGWYDAGDLVKFNFPMASSATILAWGLSRWKDGYEAAGQLEMMYDCLKWPLDYFLKCWKPSQNVYYAQVGNGGTDHAVWGRPEDMHMSRPSYKVDAGKPGSDVAGETAAALAAGSIVFKERDAGYSTKLLTAAKSLYEFAKNHKGIYSQSVPDAQSYYGSTGYNDELCEAAAWLHKATQEAKYLQDAKGFYEADTSWALSWDDKKISCQLLLFEATKEAKYKANVESFVNSYKPGGGITYTPCGLAWRDQWGSLRYAANAAFVALMAAEDGIGGNDYKTFALSQIDYILGDNRQHMSFEIGFGSNYPKQPHHRGSSCPGANCGWNDYNSGGANPHVLKGALVGGPDQGDNYADKRSDYTKNEVTCDYNAGFQSALAGLSSMATRGQLPAAPNAKC